MVLMFDIDDAALLSCNRNILIGFPLSIYIYMYMQYMWYRLTRFNSMCAVTSIPALVVGLNLFITITRRGKELSPTNQHQLQRNHPTSQSSIFKGIYAYIYCIWAWHWHQSVILRQEGLWRGSWGNWQAKSVPSFEYRIRIRADIEISHTYACTGMRMHAMELFISDSKQ